MSTPAKSCTNLSSVSIRKAHLQRCATDTNEHEKAQTPTLNIEALRNIGRIVRAIKARISAADGHQDNTAIRVPLDSGSTPATSPMGGEDSHSGEKEKR
jgi:hypothetical protein